jgi:hypothetical protein
MSFELVIEGSYKIFGLFVQEKNLKISKLLKNIDAIFLN